MKVERLSILNGGSCNFCSRGEIREVNSRYPNASLIYPYDKVTVFHNEKGNGLKASICHYCLDELAVKSAMAAL